MHQADAPVNAPGHSDDIGSAARAVDAHGTDGLVARREPAVLLGDKAAENTTRRVP